MSGVGGQREARVIGVHQVVSNSCWRAGSILDVAVSKHSKLVVLVRAQRDCFGDGNRQHGHQLEPEGDQENDQQAGCRFQAKTHERLEERGQRSD